MEEQKVVMKYPRRRPKGQSFMFAIQTDDVVNYYELPFVFKYLFENYKFAKESRFPIAIELEDKYGNDGGGLILDEFFDFADNHMDRYERELLESVGCVSIEELILPIVKHSPTGVMLPLFHEEVKFN